MEVCLKNADSVSTEANFYPIPICYLFNLVGDGLHINPTAYVRGQVSNVAKELTV